MIRYVANLPRETEPTYHSMSQYEQELIERIRAAFAGVELEDGISLNMTEYNDSGGCMPEFKVRALTDERKHWDAIKDETLEWFTGTFHFTDLKGFRFYIPAYMIWTIRNHRTSGSIISDFTVYAISPSHYLFQNVPFLRWFTSEQVEVMRAFLEYASRNMDGLDHQAALRNLAEIRWA